MKTFKLLDTMKTFNGILDITIHEAQLTSAPQTQDLYCLVTLGSSGIKNLMEGETWGKEKFQTKVLIGTSQRPVWNETHGLSLNKMTFESHLKVKLYDKDTMKPNYLGVAKINLDELLRYDGKGVQYFPLYKEETMRSTWKSIGQVGVAVKFNCTDIPSLGHTDTKTQAHDVQTGQQLAHFQGPQSTYQEGPAQIGQVAHDDLGAGTTHDTVRTSNRIDPATTLNGTIEFTISDARIPTRQRIGKQDPYCIVTFGGGGLKNKILGKNKFQTKVHNQGGQNPIWNETHALKLKNKKLDTVLEVRVYDSDLVLDDYIGIVTRTLGDLLAYDRKGVQYFTLHKKASAVKQATIKDEDGNILEDGSGQIGEIGFGVTFNCSEIPLGQTTDTMSRNKTENGTDGTEHTQDTIIPQTQDRAD